MGRFEPKTFSDFVERMTARIVARTRLSDTEVGGVLSTITAAVAREFDDLHYQMVNLQQLWDIETATGEDLDARGADINPDEVKRLEALKATGTLSFHRTDTTIEVVIPAGTVAETADNVQYKTVADATMIVGIADIYTVAAIALVAGEGGNLDIGLRKSLFIGATGVTRLVGTVGGIEDVNNDTVFSGGQDNETDAQYRERMKAYMRSLPRGTPDALKFAVLGVTLPDYGRVATAEVIEQAAPNLGEVIIYVDDGSGTIEHSDAVVSETLADPAAGGELRLFLAQAPVVNGSTITLIYTPITTGTPVTLVEGLPTDAAGTYDYMLNRPQGKVTLVPLGPNSIPDAATSAVGVAGLQPNDTLSVSYSHYIGLIQEAQKVVDGDPADRANYAGYRAAGVTVSVLSALVYYQTIEATVTVDSGYDSKTVLTAVESAIMLYINNLTINGDVIASEIIYAAQSVTGVFDISFTSGGLPITLTNTIIGEGELARIVSSGLSISGA